MKNIFLVLSFIFGLYSCSNNKEVDVSDIQVNSDLVRFDSLFFDVNTPEELSSLKDSFPLMFPKETSDSVWMNKIKNKEERIIYTKADSIFGNFNEQYNELVTLFKHVKYYYPEFKSPRVFTIISDFDYRYPVLYTPERLFISLDMYLGVAEKEYIMFPQYLVNNMVKERIKVDVATAISKTIVAQDRFDRTLLSKMIYEGKLLFLSQKFIPSAQDSLLIGYTEDQMEWCRTNEFDIWSYMVKNKLIYDSNDKTAQRFIDVAPFTKFYLELDQQSPGRVGVWLGWQIVNSYMKNNDVSLDELMRNSDAKEIFRNSRYKPSK